MEIKKQRTNGPVNAHLIYVPNIRKNMFSKFDSCKIGQGQLRVIIHTNCVELEFKMPHAKFHDHWNISSVGKDF